MSEHRKIIAFRMPLAAEHRTDQAFFGTIPRAVTRHARHASRQNSSGLGTFSGERAGIPQCSEPPFDP
jgi:hypothetical protein